MTEVPWWAEALKEEYDGTGDLHKTSEVIWWRRYDGTVYVQTRGRGLTIFTADQAKALGSFLGDTPSSYRSPSYGRTTGRFRQYLLAGGGPMCDLTVLTDSDGAVKEGWVTYYEAKGHAAVYLNDWKCNRILERITDR